MILPASSTSYYHDTFSKTLFGFWIYLMTDCVLFGTLFVTHAVLHTEVFGGPTFNELFTLKMPLFETMVLLTSSIAMGFGMISACKNKLQQAQGWLILTFLLGLSFIFMEASEFTNLIREGHGWKSSAAMSSFFTLVGTHGIHVSFGLIWLTVLFIQLSVQKLTATTFRRLACFTLFWHFLDLIWIFIFTFVYLEGLI